MNCIICNKKAIHRFSPDMDIKGIGACKKHQQDVFLAYMILVSGEENAEKLFNKFIKELKEDN